MDQNSQVPCADGLSVQPGNLSDDKEQADGYANHSEKPHDALDSSLQNDEKYSRVDDRSGRVHPTVDIAEVLRHWTHALQRIHKQSIQLSKANDGEGPELLPRAQDPNTSGHAESLAVTLGEHRQHLASIQHHVPKILILVGILTLGEHRQHLASIQDFDKVWPIFDSAQSRDFRKVVQSLISELESQGALPRSNSRVSSLATCCGPRFVELLWQLSLHALREVHRRTFAVDVASNPLPASLTDVAFSHAATLLPVTKARIALERRRFLKNAETAVQRQAMWSNLAHEMTSEFRGLCAEEAYLQQELEKLHDLRNKVKLEGGMWDKLVSSSSQNSHLVQRTTHLWDSLLARKSQQEVLASGPIEDLIAHREHRYRISGSSLLAAMDQNSQLVEYAAVLELLRIYLETRFYWGDIYWSAARNGTREVDLKKVAKKLQESATSKKAVIKVSLEELLICSLSK